MNCKTVLISSIIFGFISLSLNSQITNNLKKPSLTKYSLAEKIYLQIDNTFYQTGETIWFKAVVSKSFDNSLSDISEILQVELLDFNETIIEKKLLKLKDGISSGSFELQKSYKSGKYMIRAYTNWNRNFKEDFIFSQTIDVFNLNEKGESENAITNVVVNTGDVKFLSADISPKVLNPKFRGELKLYIDTGSSLDSVALRKDKNNIYKLNYELSEKVRQVKLKFNTKASSDIFKGNNSDNFIKTIVLDKDYLDVQFFPEGGKLVNGLINKVAFKSADYKGLGYKISGVIKNEQGKIITTFKSNKLGLGTFKLLPESGKKYYAEFSIDNINYKYNLPLAENEGSVLSVVQLKEDIKVLLVSNKANTDHIRVQTESRGVKYHDLSFRNRDTINMVFSSKSLPEGIIKLSVLNNIEQVICERIIFNTKSDSTLEIDLDTDEKAYSQRDKTILKIQLDSLQEFEKTSLSVLVLDKERHEATRQYKPNLMSYLLMNSELKGFIENPSYYFDSSNSNRLLDLDALMLTQGWRNYKYQNIIENTNYRFKPEKHLVVSGTIGEYLNPKKRPKKPLDLNMIVYDDSENIYKQEIDSNGRFYFEIEDVFKPETEFFMQVVNKKGAPKNFVINLDKKWQPDFKIAKTNDITLPEHFVASLIEKSEFINQRQQDFQTYQNAIALDEVELRDYKLTPAREKSIEQNGEPDFVIDRNDLDQKEPSWSSGLFSLLHSHYSDIFNFNRGTKSYEYAITRGAFFTFFLFDGKPVYIWDYQYIPNFPIDDIESIDIIKFPKDPYKYEVDTFGRTGAIDRKEMYSLSIVNVYTYSKRGLFGSTKSEGVLTDFLTSFSESVEFYAPNYNVLTNQDWVIPDNRSVIHWSPEITLNAEGDYILEYYNDDHIGEVTLIVEAISKNGKIGYAERTYTIKKAER